DIWYGLTENVQGPTKGIPGFITVTAPIKTLLQGAVTPKMAPPTGVTIGGMAATSDLMGVGDTPVIAWTAPAMGTPTIYRARIYSFDANGRKTVADFYTTDTSVALPSGVLQMGTTYAAAIQASMGVADIKAPYRTTPTDAEATALTKLFT